MAVAADKRHYSKTMTHLMPEQRLDKNGVLNTKHVRATPKTKVSSSLLGASPKAATGASKSKAPKPATKAQQKVKPMVFTASLEHRDPDLLASLGIDDDLGIYRFRASDEQFYDVLTVTGKGNAIAFMQAGIKSADDAAAYLLDNGFENLLEDNTELAMKARERRVGAEDFVRYMRDTSEEEIADHRYWDSVDVLTSSSLSHCAGLARNVREGTINYDDVKTIGATRISKSVGWDVISEGLVRVASGEAKYTAEDMKKIVERYGEDSNVAIEYGLSMSEHYGSDFVVGLNYPSTQLYVLHEEMLDKGFETERAQGLVKYFDDMGREGWGVSPAFDPTLENLIRFYDADVSPADALHGRVTLHQLDAIDEHGISASMSSGWL